HIVVTISDQFAGDLFPDDFMTHAHRFTVGVPWPSAHAAHAGIRRFSIGQKFIGADEKAKLSTGIDATVTLAYVPATITAHTKEARRAGRLPCTNFAVE